jgi:hypothetical protein
MTRQDQFKQELFELLRKYKVEMCIEDDNINFFSYSEFDSEFNEVAEMIDLHVRWANGKE